MNHEEHNCGHCGQPGAVLFTEYVGGHGYEDQWLCEDRVECWRRWNRQHGFTPTRERAGMMAEVA
jgi:hypothetical protein